MVHIAVPEALLTLLAMLGYALLGLAALALAPIILPIYVLVLAIKGLFTLARRVLCHV